MNNKIEAVIFDLGRVLIEVDLTRGLFKYARNKFEEDDNTIMEHLFADPLFISFAAGKIEPNEFYEELSSRFGVSIGFEHFVREWCDVFKPMPGIKQLFSQITKRYPVGLLSDIDPLHWNYIRNELSFINSIKKPTLSFEIGVLKPDAQSYRTAAQNVGYSPQNCLFIDDREINVQGALDAGMEAIRFSGTEALRSDLKKMGILTD